MHIYVLARGLLAALKEWENFMSSQYLKFQWKNKDGKLVNGLARIQVREVKIYEIVCPKDQEDRVMALIKPGTEKGVGGKWGKMVKPLRKLLGLKKPSTNWEPFPLPDTEGISMIALGTKDDKLNWTKKDSNNLLKMGGTPQEML